MSELKPNIERALQVVSELCRGERTWVMHVPVREDDPDIVITNGLMAGEEAIKQLTAVLAAYEQKCKLAATWKNRAKFWREHAEFNSPQMTHIKFWREIKRWRK